MLQFKSIRSKILFGFIITLAIVIVMSVLNVMTLRNMIGYSEEMTDKQLPIMIEDELLAYNMLELESLARGYLLMNDPELKEEFDYVIGQGEEIKENILEMTDTGTEEVMEVFQRKSEWESSLFEAIEAHENGDKVEALKILNRENDAYNALQGEVIEYSDNRKDLIHEAGASSLTYAKGATIFTVILSSIVVLVSIVVALLTARSITRPIIRVKERMSEVAQGRLDLEHLDIHTKDEVASLMEATNQMTRNNRELLLRISEVSHTVSSQSEELTQAASEVQMGTEQSASTMQELASGAEVQANSASDLTNIMSNFTETVSKADENTRYVQRSSEKVQELTTYGAGVMQTSSEQMGVINQLVRDSVDQMKNLDQQAQDIGKLVAVINDIADQTNLLALNAAIEAARAGENGRGFAVVADEVRKLAEQVGLSINDITGIITNIQRESENVSKALEKGFTEVEQGTSQIEATEKTFHHIREQVEDMNGNIQTVSSNLEDIVANNEQMAGSIEDIASVSEEAAAGIEQTAAASEQSNSSMEEVAGSSRHLATLAEELNELVARYKL